MTFDEYQKKTKETAKYPKEHALTYLCLGVASEGGEVAGKMKKFIRDSLNSDDAMEAILAEVGDVLWYCARIADELGVSLEEVAKNNIAKLKDRNSRNVISGNGDNR
jgi:NTP pyrophosphatase (non-canonical NTP hydrolase)